MSNSAEPAEKPAEKPAVWWKTLLWGLASLAAAVLLYWYLDSKERSGESFRIQWMLALVYDLLGKWGVAGIFLVIGVVCVVLSARQRQRSAPPRPAAADRPPYEQRPPVA
jgi:hypothetical protein